MTDRVQTCILEGRTLRLKLDETDLPHSVLVSVSIDGIDRLFSVEPGWRQIGIGTAGVPYIWSARRLVVFQASAADGHEVIPSDEDIVAVFRFLHGYLLVCESSVRIVHKGEVISRVDLANAVVTARLGAELIVEFDTGATCVIAVANGKLALIS